MTPAMPRKQPPPRSSLASGEARAERVAKVIARAGLASRREAETWIAAGRVAINGATITSPAVNVGAKDRVSVDGKPLPARERTRLFLYHKPRGLLTTIPVADPWAARAEEGISGELPSAIRPPSGCRFRTKCLLATQRCAAEEPLSRPIAPGHDVACHYPLWTSDGE